MKILIISATPLIKSVTNVKPVTKFLRKFNVEEKDPGTYTEKYSNLSILQKYVSDFDAEKHKLTCSDGIIFEYKKLCICTGSSPKLISNKNKYVFGIRDTETVQNLQEKLAHARQIVIVGNGGIATELVHEIENCKIIWAIKDQCISHVYFDVHAAGFFQNEINKQKDNTHENETSKRERYTITKINMKSEELKEKEVFGSALGPDWALDLLMKGKAEKSRQISIEYNCEVKRILTRNEYRTELLENKKISSLTINDDDDETMKWPVFVELNNNKFYGCDFIISATGVMPAIDVFTKKNKFDIGSDGGLMVNDQMETNIKDVYAAGDACCASSWNHAEHWFQMRLWNQASQMGDYAARSMHASFSQNQKIDLDFCFEMFAHITKFFNYKVILLGNFDARGLGNDYELLLRCTEGDEYVKIVIHNGRVYGALLIGETELEETFENLILNQIDVSPFGADLINPDIDIEDYFD